jgi:hypothetical protein
LAVLIWAGAVLGALAVNGAVARHVRDQQRSAATSTAGGAGFSSSSSASGSTPQPFDARTVSAADPRSLFRRQNLARVLTTVRSHVGSQASVDTVNLSPGALALTIRHSGGETVVNTGADGSYSTVNTGSGSSSASGFALGEIAAAAPETLARRINTAGHTPLAQLRYMLLSRDPIGHRLLWQVYTDRSSTYFSAHGDHGPITAYTAGASRTLPG